MWVGAAAGEEFRRCRNRGRHRFGHGALAGRADADFRQ